MSVNVHIAGVRDQDGMLGDMVDLKELCDKTGAKYPKELEEYFDNTDALQMKDRNRIMREASEVDLEYGLNTEGLVEGSVEYEDGMTIDLSKLPEDIKRLRVYMQ